MDEVHAQGEHAAGVVETDLDFVYLSPLVVDREEVLLPILGPLDRAAQPHRGEGHEQLVGVEQHDLRAEAAAHVRSDDLHAGFREAEQDRQAAANRCRRLGGVVDSELLLRIRPPGPHCSRLHRAGGASLETEMQALPVRGGLHRRTDVAHLLQHLRGDVAGYIVVDEVLRGRCHLRRDHHRQWLVVDLHELGCILGDVATVGHDERDGFAGIAHDL